MEDTACAAASGLTKAQEDELFERYAQLGDWPQRERFEAETAERLGVSVQAVHSVTRDERRIQKRLEEAGLRQRWAMILLCENALAAVAAQVELMNRDATTDQQLRMKQSAATDIMNRLGLARERDEPRDARIVITGMEPGMPHAAQENTQGKGEEEQDDG